MPQVTYLRQMQSYVPCLGIPQVGCHTPLAYWHRGKRHACNQITIRRTP
jgi:hypothetical protein